MFGLLCVVFLCQACIAIPSKCALESTCRRNATTEEVCVFDEQEACIRQYPSKCHLDIAACKLAKNFTDNSNSYCAMESFLCEKGYERWTIFFDHENEKEEKVLQPVKKIIQPAKKAIQPAKKVIQPAKKVIQPTNKVKHSNALKQ